MADYRKMYVTLFNRVTDIIEKFEKMPDLYALIAELKAAQRETEEMYIDE